MCHYTRVLYGRKSFFLLKEKNVKADQEWNHESPMANYN